MALEAAAWCAVVLTTLDAVAELGPLTMGVLVLVVVGIAAAVAARRPAGERRHRSA